MDFTITTIILLITIVILVGLCIYFIYNSVIIQTRFIDPSQCPSQTSEFGVIPQTSGTTVLNTCGDDGKQVCTFSNIASLSEAINICNQFADSCTAFSYAPGVLVSQSGTVEGVMSIVSTSAGFAASTTYDTYTRQILATVVTP